MNNENKTTYNQKELLELGFTKGLIKKFLPEPKLVMNPFYLSGPKIKHWDKILVDNMMQTEEFKMASDKLESKREKARLNAHKTVLKNHYNCIDSVKEALDNIVIEHINYVSLKKLALEYLKDSIQQQGLNFYYPNEDTLKRWMLNYIRHELTSYDYTLCRYSSDPYSKKFYVEYKAGLLDKIGEVYPELKTEASEQSLNLRIGYDLHKLK